MNRSRAEVRSRYLIGTDARTAPRVWSVLLDVLGGTVARAHMDAFPDPSWPVYAELEPDIRAAQQALERIGETRSGRARNTKMGAPLDLRNPEHLEILRLFGPFSIHCEVCGDAGVTVAVMHDEGTSCSALLSEDEVRFLRSRFAAGGLSGEIICLPPRRGLFGRRRRDRSRRARRGE